MLIRCSVCDKLFYFDDARDDDHCPACDSPNTEYIAMSFVFSQPVETKRATPERLEPERRV